MNSEIGKDATKSAEDALKITLTSQARDTAARLVAQDKFQGKFVVAEKPDSGPVLSVVGGVVATFVSDTDVRPYVILKASLKSSTDQSMNWSTRYIASSAPARPLVGEGSWTENGGKALREVVSTNLERAIAFMLNDVSTPHVRDDAQLTTVLGDFPFIKQRLQAMGYRLSEDNESIGFVPKVGDVLVFSGVNILDRKTTSSRPARNDDPVLKIVEAGEQLK